MKDAITKKKKMNERYSMRRMLNRIKQGATEEEIIQQFPELHMHYHGAIGKMCSSMNKGQRTWKSIVTLIIGPTGVGKSKHCSDNYPDAYWLPESNNNWWDGYNGQETVIIDGFDYSWIQCSQLKRLLDRYPMQVNIKGGSRQFVAKEIIITTSRDPRLWYTDDNNNKLDEKALMRRIDKIIVMSEPNEQIIFNGHEEYITAYPNPYKIYM